MSPLPGDWGTVATGGWAAKLIRWATHSDVNHAFLFYDVTAEGRQRILEMGPDGLKVNPQHYGTIHWSAWPLTQTERAGIVDQMRDMAAQDWAYNWLADLYIGMRTRFGIHTPRLIWKLHARVSPRQYQCAQLVDYVYASRGVHLFSDGRSPGQVSPADLRNLNPFTCETAPRHRLAPFPSGGWCRGASAVLS